MKNQLQFNKLIAVLESIDAKLTIIAAHPPVSQSELVSSLAKCYHESSSDEAGVPQELIVWATESLNITGLKFVTQLKTNPFDAHINWNQSAHLVVHDIFAYYIQHNRLIEGLNDFREQASPYRQKEFDKIVTKLNLQSSSSKD